MSVAALSRHFREFKEVPRKASNAGVYVLIDGEVVVYVGSSRDCLFRILTHREPPDAKRHPPKKFDRALWLPLPAAVHGDYEGALIRAFLPKYNATAPVDRGHDAEILDGFGISQLSGRDWRAHFRAILESRGDSRLLKGTRRPRRVRRHA